MARKPQRPCREIGCGKLTRENYCETHTKIGQESIKKIRQDYNKYKRDAKIDAFYHSPEWRKVRLLALERDNYLCQRCLKQGKLTKAKIVHHIKEVKDYWELRLVLENLESTCFPCHNREHKTSPRG